MHYAGHYAVIYSGGATPSAGIAAYEDLADTAVEMTFNSSRQGPPEDTDIRKLR